MDYLLVSDIHGDRTILEKIVNHYHDQVHAMFFNGDSELSADDELFRQIQPVIGNMDFDELFPDDRLYGDRWIKIYQTHGHLYHTEASLNQIRTHVATLDADVVTLGHTHQLGAEIIDGKLFINPGSISLPRGPYAYLKGTYAILSVQTDNLQVQFYNRELEPIEGLNFIFDRRELGMG
ncbi:YfcE family phosphodiesterase [Weissella coleopterorum]|uniref:Phosphoesterase n=1 Tax=Weissella coleopterorum TaxID=2714949 RepID=A0A6G8B0Y1_9LACO|nr:YfcE family phosphodiesterase [Weissella coleopterorum]QIL50890.1 YfcE family phosphodiesterase [Weissella coleopterorum]